MLIRLHPYIKYEYEINLHEVHYERTIVQSEGRQERIAQTTWYQSYPRIPR